MGSDKTGKVDKSIFVPTLLLLLIGTVPLLLWPESSFSSLDRIKVFIERNFGVVYIWMAIGTLAFVLWIALSKYGSVRLGNRAPHFSTFSWASMLFGAGVATGILYWGTIEWAYYYDFPPFGLEPRSEEAIEWAATYGMFHWGVAGWAFYVLPTLAIGYAYYVRRIPLMRISTACDAVIGKQSRGPLGKLLDITFMVGLLGSSGTSLGLGIPMMAAGLGLLLGFEVTFSIKIGVILLCTMVFSTSVYLGLEKGIRRLSTLNSKLALTFLALVLFMGPTVFILKMGTNSIGLMVQEFFRMITWTDPVQSRGFVEDWSIFYWAWWIAVGPFMGIFVAKISMGRSIRQIVFGTVGFGTLGSAVFYIILGNFALSQELNGLVPVTEMVSNGQTPEAIVTVIASLPAGKIMLAFFCIVGLILMSTSFDSTSYALASCATQELELTEDPVRWHRLFWAFALVLLPVGLIYVGGLDSLKTAVLISALPLVVVFIIMAVALVRSLREDHSD